MGSGGGSVLYLLDRRAGRRELMDDWVLVHELLHFACPLLPAEHHWFEEGLSTWLEPLVRFRAGWITAEEVWRELHEDMRNGLPRPGDQGLDRTRTWGNTYWGGALFCMLADVEIRERSGGELALGDALRAIVEAGGSIAVGGTMRETLATGDAALGFDVLVPLWERVRHTPLDIDLDELWERLGVSRARRPGPDEVGLDDDAPLARVRRAIAGDLTVRFPARP
jgi:predicted metalloprotease with PDZ domain